MTTQQGGVGVKGSGASVGAVAVASGDGQDLGPDTQMVYTFGPGGTEGDGKMKKLLGGKGANLAEMTRIGLPVPPGFTITTDTCAGYHAQGGTLPDGLLDQVRRGIASIEEAQGKRFGDENNPLLVSVRSGAAVSMPGMMDTILNLGLNDTSVEALARVSGNPRFAYDAYRRLINMFGDVVMGVEHELFERAFEGLKRELSVSLDTEVPTSGIMKLCDLYKDVYKNSVGEPFPQDPFEQLHSSIEAVFKSWNSGRAISYRRIGNIQGLNGTAVNVQAMVFGNFGDNSGTGVAFTRDPSTGENTFYGEFLVNAQGEDVVAGIRTPKPIVEMGDWDRACYDKLVEIKGTLEAHYRDMQDIEFTVERGELYMLQTRNGKRTGRAAVKLACDMAREGLIDETEAVRRVPAGDITQLLLPTFDAESKKDADVLTSGLPASPGAAVGKPAFTAEEAVERQQNGENVILVRKETSPEDVEGMHSAVGILTSTGGMTSHAAVVARGWGKCCVAGAGDLSIDAKAGTFTVGGRTFGREDVISIDGTTGEVMAGAVKAPPPTMSEDFQTLMEWADKLRRMRVRTNADTPEDAARAREFGAEGIGLCRTEHMFFEAERITIMREMILSDCVEERQKYLGKLLPMQRSDFEGIFEAMDGCPVTVRLLDPPLHEFLPHDPHAIDEIAKDLGISAKEVEERAVHLAEANPMLGHRGCRLAITYPEILRMQVRAIVEAALNCAERGIDAQPEIMIPLVGTAKELEMLRRETEEEIASVRAEHKAKGDAHITIGTMIEVPRAAVTAGDIARHADFFSFGTNDLTQLTFGYSRDDVNHFLPDYLKRDILPIDPFQSIDQVGVGKLVEMGVAGGRDAKPGLKIGVCGEHGGDPASVKFFERMGLDYVSCSPFRVPIARLAAAQATLGA